MRILGVDNAGIQAGAGQGAGARGQPQCVFPRSFTCLPPGPPLPQLFMEQESPPHPTPPHPSPAWAATLLLRSQTLHAISRLSAFALAVPSAKCLPYCPCLSTTSSFFRVQLGCLPEPPALITCLSLCVLLALHLCLPSVFVAESTQGFASWRLEVEHILPCTPPPWTWHGVWHLVGVP